MVGKLAVIGTFYKRYEKTEMLLNRVLVESSRPPDEFWMMCEEEADAEVAYSWQERFSNLHIKVLNTPRTATGGYEIIPYSNKINWALDNTTADYIAYLDNNSIPHVKKYELMSNMLDKYPECGAVFCFQNRTGYLTSINKIDNIIRSAFNVLNYTQVMHRKTSDRWVLEMEFATPEDVADAMFWNSLHISLGDFYPTLTDEILDEHYMESSKAAGL